MPRWLVRPLRCLRLASHPFSPLLRLERGFTGVEFAIISLAGGAVIFTSAVVIDGSFAGEQLSSVVRQSFGRLSGTLELRGTPVVRASGRPLAVDTIEIVIGTFGDPPSIAGDSQATDGLLVAYRDDSFYSPSVPYSLRFLSGNGDDRLDAGELAHLTIRLADLAGEGGAPALAPGRRWTLELTSPAGVTLSVSRRLPAAFEPVMALP